MSQEAISKLEIGNSLLLKLSSLENQNPEGLGKLRRRVEAEIKWIKKKLKSPDDVKREHIVCSNLGQLESLINTAVEVGNACGLLQNFTQGGQERLGVDIIAEDGKRW